MSNWSLALRDIAAPDFADAAIASLPAGASTDPAEWANRLFSLRAMPRWVAGALAVRQLLVPLLGLPKSPADTFAVREREAHEVLMAADERHLDFRCAVAVDPEARLLRVTTAVRLHGWRGRLYFAPVRLLHPVVVQAMIRSAVRSLGGRSGTEPNP